MTKKQIIEYIDKKYEWFIKMQKPLGNDNWWYSNRSSEDCINIKINAWVDVDDVKKTLTPVTLKIIDTLNIDLDEMINDISWGDFGLVDQAREDMETELKTNYHIDDFNYGGKSGGWLCVVYNWDDVPEDYDQATYKELQGYKKIIDEAETEHAQVTETVNKLKKQLCQSIENVEYYTEEIEQRVDDTLDTKRVEAKRILAI